MPKLYSNPYIRGFVLSLEITAKPFKSRDPKDVDAVLRKMFNLWQRPIAHADEVCVCMSFGNGEHILKWSGNMDDEVEWDKYKGHNNAKYAFNMDSFAGIPLEPYVENPLKMTYRDLGIICDAIKRVCAAETGKKCRLFTNFEPGPEFSESTFKYVEHPEILNKQGAAHGASVAFDAVLHKDTYHYAAYPDGIPEGEPFSRFLGKQVDHFFKTFGYEGLSLSNGMGFGTFPWTLNGRNFDGKQFGLVDFKEESESMSTFWESLKKEAPYPTAAQGTNWPVASDLATKCIPLRDYYDKKYLDLPLCNTVSVFFNDSVGFSMQALMSRSSYADGFRIYFYLNDMWYPQNPFEDYPYDEEAYDLYIPASMSLVDSSGNHEALSGVALSVGNENGEFAESTFHKFLPHYERALSNLPDAVGPLTLLYPFEQFHTAAADPGKKYLPMLYFTDCYAAAAIDNGLSLNSVCSTENFEKALKKGTLDGTILMTVLPMEGASYTEKLIDFIKNGGQVLFYGSEKYADKRIKDLLGLKTDTPIDGELALEALKELEDVSDEPLTGAIVKHMPVDSDGGVSCVAEDCRVLCEVIKDGVRRAYMTEKEIGCGKAVWVRGSLPFSIENGEDIVYQDSHYVSSPRFMRYALSRFGWKILESFSQKSNPMQLMMFRHDNGLYFTGYAPDNTLSLGLSTPMGAPLLPGFTTEIKDGTAWYHVPTTLWKPCNIFVKQKEGKIRLRHVYNSRKFKTCTYAASGLDHAEILISVPEKYWDSVEITVSDKEFSVTDNKLTDTGDYTIRLNDKNHTVLLSNVTGKMQVSW